MPKFSLSGEASSIFEGTAQDASDVLNAQFFNHPEAARISEVFFSNGSYRGTIYKRERGSDHRAVDTPIYNVQTIEP
jgi:hypothetical protein